MFLKLKNKKIIVITVFVFLIVIFLIFFLKNNYKIFETGNTMSNKSIEEMEEYILNISSYEAEVAVTIESNKNNNKYVMKQQYIAPNLSKQTILEPSNIEGIQIVYDGENLQINNSKLNLSKIYENYEYIANNVLCLESFIQDYIKSKVENITKRYEENGEYVLVTKIQINNQYRENKKLYIDKNTGKPTKLLVQDINEKTVVYILYNEIKINDLKEQDILAMQTIEPYVRVY